MTTYHISTVGCQMNKADSERLASGFEQLGLSESDDLRTADVVVLNTCVVRQSAEDTATGVLGVLKKCKEADPKRRIAVMGCMVGPKTDELSRRFPQVDAWARPQQFGPILEMAGEVVGIDPDGCVQELLPADPKVATFIPIIHGCDKFCSFCIIPYRRGREVSRPLDQLVRETEMLVSRGVREVTLLGQNVDSYGHDLDPATDLADLLYAVNEVDGLERIRFLTSHPSDMSEKIIRAVGELPKVCENINLPFQAGDDAVLARMRRGYTRSEYLNKIEQVRSIIPNVALVTDVIVGFSGETEAQFAQTLDILREVRFDKVHSAAYSVRPGTIAARQHPDTVPVEEKKRRLAELNVLQEQICAEINAGLDGEEFGVLIDGHSKGKLQGRTRTDKLVHIDRSEAFETRIGGFANVRIIETSPWSLRGEVTAAEMPAAGDRLRVYSA
ncbi:MAG: tRNA (N6-isopentenyl adenosine(37)-C2)-methylthiotransferase MiaB [Chloroflexi bacterium]|nr:tRNA (N6-isopentenyl adenosine(37)-C2)-methylthiotransferase MiaB [Chloroflexota bacterium]